MGFEVSYFLNDGFEAWLKTNEGAEVLIRYIDPTELHEIIKEATNKQGKLDIVMMNSLVGRAAIKDWRGITCDNLPFTCNNENIDKLMRKSHAFAKFVNDACMSVEVLTEALQKAAQLSGGSEPMESQ